jgi:hypothetical protein
VSATLVKAENGVNYFRFVCEGCKSEGELGVPQDERLPIGCPEGCGATYVQWYPRADQPALECVVCPVFAATPEPKKYFPHPEIAKQLGVEGNPNCVCATPIDTLACPWGHVDGCHYPKECHEALCSHFMNSCDFEFYERIGEPIDGVEIETEDDLAYCDICGELLDECECDDDSEDDDV